MGASTKYYRFITPCKFTSLANADLNYSLIIREIDLARNIELLQFGLAKAIANLESDENILL